MSIFLLILEVLGLSLSFFQLYFREKAEKLEYWIDAFNREIFQQESAKCFKWIVIAGYLTWYIGFGAWCIFLFSGLLYFVSEIFGFYGLSSFFESIHEFLKLNMLNKEAFMIFPIFVPLIPILLFGLYFVLPTLGVYLLSLILLHLIIRPVLHFFGNFVGRGDALGGFGITVAIISFVAARILNLLV